MTTADDLQITEDLRVIARRSIDEAAHIASEGLPSPIVYDMFTARLQYVLAHLGWVTSDHPLHPMRELVRDTASAARLDPSVDGDILGRLLGALRHLDAAIAVEPIDLAEAAYREAANADLRAAA